MPRTPLPSVPGSEWITNVRDGLVIGHPGPLGDLIVRCLAAWLRGLEAGSSRTALAYRRDAERFLVFLSRSYGRGLGGLLQAQPSDVTAFLASEVALSDATRARRVAVLRSLFSALVRDGLRPTNPASDIRVRKKTSRHHVAVPQSVVLDVLRRLAGSTKPRDIRDRALLLVMLNVAGRRSEIASLTVGCLERGTDGKAHVEFTGKGRKHARMLVHASVVRAVDLWLIAGGHAERPQAPLFHSLSRRPDHRARQLTGDGIGFIFKRLFPKFSAHSARSRAITDAWAESGRNIHVAQVLARHASVTTTMTYIQPESEAWAQGFVPDYEALV